MANYVTANGEKLERRPGMFFFRGRYFDGLVDVKNNALYDDPEDSFAAVTGIPASIDKKLIKLEITAVVGRGG